MSFPESGISLHETRLDSHANSKRPRNSMSTRLLDDLLLELAPKNDESKSDSMNSEMGKSHPDKGQDQDANDRRKKIITKFQKLVLLQQTITKRDSVDQPPHESVAVRRNGRADSTASDALGGEGGPSLPKAESRSSLKLSKNVHLFSKSFSNLTKIAKTNRFSGNVEGGRSKSTDSIKQSALQERGSTATNETWKQNAPERSSRFSLLKKMNSLSRLGADTSEDLLNSSYSQLNLDDDPTEAADAADDASLGDYVEYTLGESLSSAARFTQSVDDQRNLGNSAHKPIAQASIRSLDAPREHPLAQRRRSSSCSMRSISSIERRSTSRQRNQSRNRRTQTQQHGSDDSLRALVDVLSGEVPTDKVPLESKIYQRRKMKRRSFDSATTPEPASMPNLLSYEEDALSVRAPTISRHSNRRKEWKNDNSSLMHSPRVRSNRSMGSRSLSKLPRVDCDDSNGHHNATWDIGSTTERKLYLRRSVTSKAHQDLLNSNSVQDVSIFAREPKQRPQGDEDATVLGAGETKMTDFAHRVQSIKSINNRSLPNLQAITKDVSTVSSVSKQRRRSTLVRGDHNKNDELRLTRSPSAGSTISMGSRSLATLETMKGVPLAGSVSESNRNATWAVNSKKERHSISYIQSPGVRPLRSGKRRSLPNIQGVQDDTFTTGLDQTSDLTNGKAREMLAQMPPQRKQSLKSKSMGIAIGSLPNLQTIHSPGVYKDGTCDDEDGEAMRQLLLNSPALHAMQLMANRSLPTLEVVQGGVYDGNMNGRHNATWESQGATTQDQHLQLVLCSPRARSTKSSQLSQSLHSLPTMLNDTIDDDGPQTILRLSKARSARSSSQLSQSSHSLRTNLATDGIIDDALIAALRSSRARRSVRSSSSSSSQLNPSLHSHMTRSSGTTMDETNGRDHGTRRRRRSSTRRSIRSSVSCDGYLSVPNPQDGGAGADSSVTTSSSIETTNEGNNGGRTSCETTKVPVATTLRRSSRPSTSLDRSRHDKMLSSTKGINCATPSSTPSNTTIRHATSSLDLLLQTPRLQQRGMRKSLGNGSLPDLQCFAKIGMDSGSSLGVDSHNANWDLDEAKEKAKSRTKVLKKTLGSQSFSNLEDIELLRSSSIGIHPSAREQPQLSLPIQVR